MEQIIQQLTVTQKRNIIKNSDALSELFKNKTNKALSKAKGEDIDNFISELNDNDKKILADLAGSEVAETKKAAKALNKKDSEEENKTEEEASSDDGAVEEESEEEKEIPEEIIKKIFKDLYPTSIHKTKYIQDNPSLKMAALTKGILGKNAKKEDIDDFLVKQVPKNPKSMKQLSIDWLENKKTLKIEVEKLASEDVSDNDIRSTLSDVSVEDFETYCFLNQSEINRKVFSLIDQIRQENLEKQENSTDLDSEKVKNLEAKIKELENKLSETEDKQKDEISNYRQNYDLEKEKLKSKYEQKLETQKNKYEEEKSQLIKIQADSDRRFAEERKTYFDQIDKLDKENKKLLERINNIGSDLMSQNKQNKDASKSLTRNHNRIEELQTENKELNTKNEELKSSYESASSQIIGFKKQDVLQQEKIQELSLRIQELEKTKIAFLLDESEIQSVVKELNAVDESKERMFQILNIDTRHNKPENDQSEQGGTLDELWVTLIEKEEDVIADYLSIGLQEVTTKDFLKDKIDGLLDLEYNIKAREVLVKILYEKGYKAYKNLAN